MTVFTCAGTLSTTRGRVAAAKLLLPLLALLAGAFGWLAPAAAEEPGDALHALQTPGETPRRTGSEWSGRYFCGQGVTGVRLVLSDDRTRALFHFYAVPDNRGVPEGCFTMAGTFNKASDTLDLKPGKWIIRPPNYASGGVSGLFDTDDQNFLGRIIGPPGCTVISLSRAPSNQPLPKACAAALP